MKFIPLTQGKRAIVDDEDYERVAQFKWHTTTSNRVRYYAKRSIWLKGKNKSREIKMHRFILSILDNPSTLVDHKNGDGLDNRRCNLRIATKNQNTQNSTQPNKTGYKGIYKNGNRYVARIKVDGKMIRRYDFTTPEEAARYYDQLAKKYFREFAKTNF